MSADLAIPGDAWIDTQPAGLDAGRLNDHPVMHDPMFDPPGWMPAGPTITRRCMVRCSIRRAGCRRPDDHR
jgi:hypothetical protein